MANPPRKHHYLPEFYLKQWTGDDGRLVRYAAVPNGLHVRRVFPSQVGFEVDLYRRPGELEDEVKAQSLETQFFQPLDQDAADALTMLLSPAPWHWDERNRSGWTRFLRSLHHRTPEHMSATLSKLKDLREEAFENLKGKYLANGDEPKLELFEILREKWKEKEDDLALVRLLPKIIENQNIGDAINNAFWRVFQIGSDAFPFMTSDNPIIFRPLKLPGGHIALPISPSKLFAAALQEETLDLIGSMTSKALARQVNQTVIERARKVAIASDLRSEAFVRKRFGTKRIGSVMTGFAERSR